MTKHKVFISYHHANDEPYRREFEKLFGHLFYNKSVKPGEISDNNSDEYIKRLIQMKYISSSSVCLVLVGSETYKRKHVDWEISAALSKKVGGHSGLVGIIVPSPENLFYPDNIIYPPRLYDNIISGYAKVYNWTDNPYEIWNIIEEAFQNRINKARLIDNSRVQYKHNRP